MSTDLTRLVPGKSFYSFDSFGFITSAANDYGYEEVFTRWLRALISHNDLSNSLLIGMSCSGGSINIKNALEWMSEEGGNIYMIAGADKKPIGMPGIQMGFEYFHTVEIATMFLLYELIHRVGAGCPSIKKENLRNVNSPLRAFK